MTHPKRGHDHRGRLPLLSILGLGALTACISPEPMVISLDSELIAGLSLDQAKNKLREALSRACSRACGQHYRCRDVVVTADTLGKRQPETQRQRIACRRGHASDTARRTVDDIDTARFHFRG